MFCCVVKPCTLIIHYPCTPPLLPMVCPSGFTKRTQDGCIHLRTYMVMQLLGPSLHQRYRHRPAEGHELARVGRAMLHALHHLHSKGLVHRDVKPENFCTPPPEEEGQPGAPVVYITDLGFAVPFDPITGG